MSRKKIVSIQIKERVIKFMETDQASRLCSGKKKPLQEKKRKDKNVS